MCIYASIYKPPHRKRVSAHILRIMSGPPSTRKTICAAFRTRTGVRYLKKDHNVSDDYKPVLRAGSDPLVFFKYPGVDAEGDVARGHIMAYVMSQAMRDG